MPPKPVGYSPSPAASLLKYFIFDIGLMLGVLKLNVKDAICLFVRDEEVEIITSWRMCDIITPDTD